MRNVTNGKSLRDAIMRQSSRRTKGEGAGTDTDYKQRSKEEDYTDEGIATGVFADDMAFTAVFSEPEACYGAMDAYGAFEMLRNV